MRNDKQPVLVLYNVPRSQGSTPGAWLESDVGVLDEVEAVVKALETLAVPHRVVGVTRLSELPPLLSAAPERIVFNLVEGFHHNPCDANLVPALVTAYDKSSTGNDTTCLMLSLDKFRTKAVLQASGIPVPKGVVVPKGQNPGRMSFDGPFIVKPVCCDASEGIDSASLIRKSGKALDDAARRIHEGFGQDALIEQYIEGRELNVAILERGGLPEVLPIAEIDFSTFEADRPRIVGYSAKWLADTFEYKNTPRLVPTKLPAPLARRVRQMALAAWKVLGCSDYARIDMRLADNKDPHILEVNPNPDITREIGYDAELKAAGISYEEFVGTVIANAAARLEARSSAPTQQAETDARDGAGVVHSHIVKSADGKRGSDGRVRGTVPEDREPIRKLLTDTRFFRDDEIVVALEVLDDAISQGPGGDYQSYTIDCDGRPAGWICFGPTPCTVATYDIYWIAVDPAFQGRGLGKALMDFAETRIFERGGRISVVETAGREVYLPTRKFYLAIGYTEAACLADFYAPGDAKVIYIKRLDQR